MRTDTNAKRGGRQEAEATQDLDLEKGVIAVEAGSGRSHGPGAGSGRSHGPEAERGRSPGPEAGKESVASDLAHAQGQDTGTGVEAGVGQGVGVEIERRELKNQEDLAEV